MPVFVCVHHGITSRARQSANDNRSSSLWAPIEAWASTTAGAIEYTARAVARNRTPLGVAEDVAEFARVATLREKPTWAHDAPEVRAWSIAAAGLFGTVRYHGCADMDSAACPAQRTRGLPDNCSCRWWCAAREAPTNRVQVVGTGRCAGGRLQFAAHISDGEFDCGGDAASPVRDRYRDGRFAELEFVRRRDPRQSDDRELPTQDVRRGGGISWWAVSSAISRHPG